MSQLISGMRLNFSKLFVAVFFSELGGFLTNIALLLHINEITDGNKFYLGLSQFLFVGPLALGTLIGGAIGEKFDRRKVMLVCESSNLAIILSMVFFDQIVLLIMLRGIIAFFAGVYNPSRQSIVQEIVDPKNLRRANAAFTTIYAVFHSLGTKMAQVAYDYFGSTKEIFLINAGTYVIGVLLVSLMSYRRDTEFVEGEKALNFSSMAHDIRSGFAHIWGRSDLATLIKNFSVGGVCLGVFYPTQLPFLAETFSGYNTNELYGNLNFAVGLGGILGGAFATFLMKFFAKGKILAVVAILQAFTLFLWTNTSNIVLSYLVIFIFGIGMVTLLTTYINYIQVNVSNRYQSRAFSLYDQSISLSIVFGTFIVMIFGNLVSAQTLLGTTALVATIVMVLRSMTVGYRSLYLTKT